MRSAWIRSALGVLLLCGVGFPDEPPGPAAAPPPAPAKDAAPSAPRAPDPRAIHLRVVTYNIRSGKGGGKTPAPGSDLEPVARILAAEKPDLVALQEVDRFRKYSGGTDQPSWLEKRLGLRAFFLYAYQNEPGPPAREEFGVAVLSRLPIQPPVRHLLFKPDYRDSHPEYPPYYSEQRILLQTRVTVRDVGVHFFCTHLGLTPDQLEPQVKEIVDIVSKVKGPVILAGDFNGRPRDHTMAPLYAALREAKAEAGLTPEEMKTAPVGSSPRIAIDHIFVSPEFRVLSAKVIRDETLASDHNPVETELELEK